MIRYTITVFLSAFLLFLLQPIVARYILPWFGGGPAVWTTCMLLFQLLLLGGYAYAHGIAALARPRLGGAIHLGLLMVSLLFLPISPDPDMLTSGAIDAPALEILRMLGLTIGLPFLLLSSTGPLIQDWFRLARPGESPYRLYALSNVGSLLALLSYPFLIEPLLDLNTQSGFWSWGYVLFALLAGLGAVRYILQARNGSVPSEETPESAVPARKPPVSRGDVLLWLGLTASASAMLLATTNQVCLEVSVVPFLWVLPLALYLITFIIAFGDPRWYDRRVFGPLLALAAVGAWWTINQEEVLELWWQILLYSGALFVTAMTCHGELVRRKPDPQRLTLFYLMVSVGGALGGFFVALVAPRVFLGYWEFQIALAAGVSLTLVSWILDSFGGVPRRQVVMGLPLTGLLFVLLYALLGQVRDPYEDSIYVSRNFFGVVSIQDGYDEVGEYRTLIHGQIVHGVQYHDEDLRTEPVAYFSPYSGVGAALRYHPQRPFPREGDPGMRVGVIGLGAGTLAAYADSLDRFRMYEIDPQVIDIAQNWFSYLEDSPGSFEFIPGDARVQLDRELREGTRHQFDVLVVDAFSSDAIPVHLLTREAADLYWEHLDAEGILAFHISNQHLDLIPVVRGLAEHLQCQVLMISNSEELELGYYASDWMLLTNNERFIGYPGVKTLTIETDTTKDPLLWTDRFVSLWHVLMF